MNSCKNLFKGKREDNGEWIEGSLVFTNIIIPCTNDNMFFHYMSVTDSMILADGKYLTKDSLLKFYIVTPETVGRYTGWLDKNRKMIFEGDICKFTDYKKSYPFTYIGVIKYYKNINAVFESRNYCTDLLKWKSEDFEVIGNIYDNPKLIGGDTA